MLKFIFLSIIALMLLRLIIRKFIGFPKYRGVLLTENSTYENLMPEQEFWQLIEKSRIESNKNYRRQCYALTKILAELNPKEIVKFDRTFTVLMAKSYKNSLWEAAYALNGGCSDDCFEYFRTWLIGQGKNIFYHTLRNPRLLFFCGVKKMLQNYEGLRYSSYDAYEQNNGTDMPGSNDITYEKMEELFDENKSMFRYPELALLAW